VLFSFNLARYYKLRFVYKAANATVAAMAATPVMAMSTGAADAVASKFESESKLQLTVGS